MRFALFLVIFASLLTSITIEKPWNEYWWTRSNPYIYVTPIEQKEVWNSFVFHPSLENLSLEQTSIPNQEIQQKIISAKASLDNAGFYNSECQKNLQNFFSLGNLPWSTAHFLITDVLSAYGWGPFKNCIDYGIYWKETMDSSVDALILSIKKADSELKTSTETFAKVQKAGICDDEYTSAGKEECVLASNHLFNAQNIYSVIDAKANEINQNLRSPIPSSDGFQETFLVIWSSDGILSELAKANSFSLSALSKSEDEYHLLLLDFESLREKAQRKLNEMEKHNMQKIKETKTTTEFLDDSEFLQIYQRFEEAKISYTNAVDSYEKGLNYFKRKSDKYLRDSLSSLQDAHSSLLYADHEFDSLESDAISIVESKRNNALEAIEGIDVSGSESLEYAEKARKSFETAKNSKYLGDQFESYNNAILFASLAKNKKIDSTILVLLDAKKHGVEDLLKRAKKDDISINYEESLFSFISSREKVEDIELLNNIEDSVYESAELVYGSLVGERKELLLQAQLGKDETADLTSGIRKYDAYFFSDSINYPKAIGNLKIIRSEFFDIELELEKSKKKIVSNGLENEVSFFLDSVELDVPADVRLEIFLKNRYGYSADNIPVQINLPTEIPFFRTDIINGSENVGSFLQSKKKLDFELKSVPGFYQDLLVFEKKATLAYTTKYAREVIGHGDASATSFEAINFELDTDSNVNLVGKIDGLEYKGQVLKKGAHKLENQTTLFNAFSINHTNYVTSNIGLNSVLYYDILIHPNMDIDSTTVYVPTDPSEKIKSMKVSSITGEKVKEKKDLGNGIYSVVLEGLIKGREAILRVQLDIDNSSSYVSDQLSLLQNQELDTDLLTQLNNAENNYNNGNIDLSLKEIQKIKNTIEKRNLDEVSYKKELNKVKEDLTVKIRLYENVIQDAKDQNISHSSIDFILEKKLELETIITNGSLEQLKSFDYSWEKREINQIKKQSLEEYTSLKKSYLKIYSEDAEVFAVFEEAYNRLSVSNNLEDTVPVLSAIQELKAFVTSKSKVFDEENAELQDKLADLKEATKNIIYVYKKESEEASGTQFESLFIVDVKEAEGLIKSKNSDRETMNNLNRSLVQMKEILDTIKSKAKRNKIDIENLADGRFSDDIAKMNQYYDNGDFVKSLKQADFILSKLTKDKPDDKPVLILVITAIILVVGIIYSLLKRKPAEPVKIKKLERIDDV